MKNTRRFIAGLSALTLAGLMAVTASAQAADYTEIKPDPDNMPNPKPTSTGFEVKYDVDPSYTVTIPAGVDITTGDKTASITLNEGALLAEGAKIKVVLQSGQYTTSGSSFTAKTASGNSSASYQINDGNVKVGDVVASLDKDTLISTLTFSRTDTIKPTYAGTHSEVLTFGISVEGAESVGNTVDLSTLTADYEAKSGDILTGTLVANVKISIADGATVTLKDVNITNLGDDCDWAGVNCPGDASLVLKGTNTICAGRDGEGDSNYPGIFIASGKTLTIDGDGSLTAYSNKINPYGAGIGGAYRISCGNIVIKGGTINAKGGFSAAGIGGGDTASCGNIVIEGGTIDAFGGSCAAGIGSGLAFDVGGSSCGNITISGGTVTATGGYSAAGIGTGSASTTNNTCGTITITNNVTKVTATKGENSPNSIGTGGILDSGTNSCGTITIGGTETGNISANPCTLEPCTLEPSN